MIRNTHRVGDYLMMDEESGIVSYRSKMLERWDGVWVRKREYESRQPQEFVYAYNDPKPLKHIRPDDLCAQPCSIVTNCLVGETSVEYQGSGPGSKLLQGCIGNMCVGKTFQVRPS